MPKLNVGSLRLIQANSVEDFWADNLNGILFHYKNNSWETFEFPNKEGYREFLIFPRSESNFLILAIRKNYLSDIVMFNGSGFIKDGTLDMPAKGIIDAYGKTYCYGDWGSFYEKNKATWKKIKAPIKNHISAAYYTKDLGILLGTRAEGIFLFDGSNFKPIETESANQFDIMDFYLKNSKLYATTLENKTLIFTGKSFRLLSNETEENELAKSKFGFATLTVNSYGKTKTFYFSRENPISSHLLTKDEKLLITNSSGEIFSSDTQNLNYFELFKHTFKTEGHSDEVSMGAAFVDLNNDFLPEIFVYNYNGNSNLFFNKKNSSFEDISINLSQAKREGLQSFIFGDFNSDDYLDFIFIERGTARHSISWSYSNINN
ncbi:MAG: hypothetical protein Fur0015_00600 [Ignavibacteriales bacterium]